MLLGDLCLRLSFLVEVQRPAAFQSGQCSSHAAFLVGRAGQLPCCFSSGQCYFSCLFGATGTLSVPGGWTSPPLCELRTILQTDIFRHRVFRVVGLCTLVPQCFFPHSARQTSQAILAALLLFVFFVLREEFASLFQTFSRSDPPGKAPLTRGRYVFQKKRKKTFAKLLILERCESVQIL